MTNEFKLPTPDWKTLKPGKSDSDLYTEQSGCNDAVVTGWDGRNVFGVTIGLVQMHVNLAMIPGNMSNATTFDFPILYRRMNANNVADVMANVEGVTNLKVEPQVLIPQIVIDLRPSALAQFGLSPGDVRTATTTLVRGTQVGEVFEDQKIFRVVVWGTEAVRRDINALRELMIDTPTGGQVPLNAVANVSIGAR